ncbi:MAG TPA: hypothetical protein VF763_13745 [Candidatus Limnocylindrales bacterium]
MNGTVRGGWDDERLRAAYTDLADRAVPGELLERTLVAVRAAPRTGLRTSRPLLGIRAWRPRPLTVGAAAAVVIAVVAASLVWLRPGPTPAGPLAGLPEAIEGLSVRSVSEAQAGFAALPAAEEGPLVAVAGWLTRLPAPGCPYATPGPELEPHCGSDTLVLTETRQALVDVRSVDVGTEVSAHAAVGPSLVVRQLTGTSLTDTLPAGDPTRAETYEPHAAIVIGHVHDARAAACSAGARAGCEAAFVGVQLAWLDGHALGPATWVGGDAAGTLLRPRLDPTGVLAALAGSLAPHDTVVSMAAVRGTDVGTLDPLVAAAWGGATDGIVWYVRVVGPVPAVPIAAAPASPGGGAGDGVLVLDDATGQVPLGRGWRQTPAATPLPSGLVPFSPPPPGSPPPGFPSTEAGLPVRSVASVAAAGRPSFEPGQVFAVGGWLTVRPVHSCPLLTPGSALERTCGWDDLLLAATPARLAPALPAPAGPYLVPRVLPGIGLPDLAGSPTGDPTPVVLLGHFGDRRAAACPAEVVLQCQGELVLDGIVWAAGREQEPTVWVGSTGDGQPLQPKRTAAQVLDILASPPDVGSPRLVAGDRVLALAVVAGDQVTTVAPDLGAGSAAEIVWLAHVVGPQPPAARGAEGGPLGSGWIVVDDATAHIPSTVWQSP